MNRYLPVVVFAALLCLLRMAAIGQTITPSAASGRIAACRGTASVSPYIQQFTVSATGLSGNIAISAPANFELSLKPAADYGPGVQIVAIGGNVNNVVVYARSAATAPPGPISGDATLISPPSAANKTVALSGYIDLVPVVNKPPDQPLVHGSNTTPIFFLGTGQDYKWTNDNPSIGLPASGRGNIPSFKAVNNTGVDQTAHITVTPVPPTVAYVANGGNNSISVVNTVTGQVAQEITVGRNPLKTIVSPDGSRIYVVNYQGNSVYTLDARTLDRININTVPSFPQDIEISPDGKTLYVISTGSNRMTFINTETFTSTDEKIEPNPVVIMKSPDGSRVYSAADNGLTVVNTATNKVITNIPNVRSPGDIAITPNGAFVYVSDLSANKVNVISAATNTLITTVPVGGFPTSLAMHPDGTKVYVANVTGNSVSVINIADNKVISTIPANAYGGITISPEGAFVYAVGRPQDISVISTATNTVATVIPVSGNLDLPVISADGSRLFVSDRSTQSVYIINTLTNSVSDVKSVGASPFLYGNSVSQGAGCSGAPVTFKILVKPPPPPVISHTGNPTALNTTYGTPSANTSFEVSADRLTSGVLVTPPAGFEVSRDGVVYSATVTLGTTGTLPSTKVYIRLTAVNNASPNYSGDIILTSGPTTDKLAMPTSRIDPAIYTITLDDFTKTYGDAIGTYTGNSRYSITAGSLKNGNSITSITITYGTGSNATANATTYPGSVTSIPATIVGSNGYVASNYLPTIQPGRLIVNKAKLALTSQSELNKKYGTSLISGPGKTGFTPIGLKNDENIGSVTLTYGTGAGAKDKVGSYPGSIIASLPVGGTFNIDNYILETPTTPGDITVTPAPLYIIVDNKTRDFRTIDPPFTYTINGLVPGETESTAMTRRPTLSTTATFNSPGGRTYPIEARDAEAPNYAIAYTFGVLTINPSLTPPGAVLTITNTITPNGDGINDIWNLPALISYPQCTVKIFDRKGTLLFNSIGYPTPWDGTYRGSALPAGVYYYVIDPKLEAKVLSGTITIIR